MNLNLTAKLSGVSLCLVLLSGCSTGPTARNHVITAEEAEGTKLFDAIGECKDLTVNECRLLFAYGLMGGITNAFAGKKDAAVFPVGKTVGEVLEIAKKAQEEKAEKDAKEAELRAKVQAEQKLVVDQMNSALTGIVAMKQFAPAKPMEGNYEDLIGFAMAFRNTSNKPIKAFKGTFQFRTELGDEVSEIHYAEDNLSSPIKPGAEYRVGGTKKFNQFEPQDVKLRDTDLANLKVTWVPNAILFADGTKLAVEGDQ